MNGNLVGRINTVIFATDINGNPVLANNGGPTKTVGLSKGSVANAVGAPLATLTSAVTAGATVLAVTDSSFITVGDMLSIDSEIVLVTAINANNLTVVRAQGGTTGASHAQDAEIVLAYDQTGAARPHNDLGSLNGTERKPSSGTSNLITILEDHSYTFSVNDFGFFDANNIPPFSLKAVKITTLPANGTLKDNGVAVTKGQFVSVADITGSLLVYTPTLDGNGTSYGTFTFQVQDDGGTAGGGLDTDPVPKTMSINVTGVNDAPIGTSSTLTTLQNTAYTFKVADFGFTDPHDNPSNLLFALSIGSTPANGTLTDNNIPVSAGQLISAADILGNKLVFTPFTNQVGTPYANFTFKLKMTAERQTVD